jgi:hypothetical protein
MLRAFIFGQVAVVVRHWFEIGVTDGAMEHGARLELRQLQSQEHRGTQSAAQYFGIDRPVWRADLFDRLDGTPGGFEAAHFHPRFDGNEPTKRVWPADISSDPWGWLQRQLCDLHALCDAAGVSMAGIDDDAEDLRREVDAIVQAAQSFAPARCTSALQCHEWTRDVATSVRLMVSNVDNGDRLDRDRVALWLAS